ncbi:MAG: RluA family pseudouridine synthase [Elusimicrobia bacterium]|nr:RluA family pseudouridine synthase [Elusimicrobiota bacterium]
MIESPWVEVPFKVQDPQDGLRLDRYLTARLHRYSRNKVQELIESGQVFLRGRSAKASQRVSAGETIIIRYPRREEPPCPHQTLQVLYEDAEILAVNKPGDTLSHPTDKAHRNTVTSILRGQFPDLAPRLVHRLDRETSGVLVLAKSREAARALTEQFAAHVVKKEYWAIALGQISWAAKTVDIPVGREDLEVKVRQKAGSGQEARTEFERLALSDGFSLVKARPLTGRLHQIRVHLAHLGHPILGDKLYAGAGEYYMKAVRRQLTTKDRLALGAERQMLHSRALGLAQPSSGRELLIEAPLPRDFEDCLARTGLHG